MLAQYLARKSRLGETAITSELPPDDKRFASSDPSGILKIAAILHAPFSSAAMLRISSCPWSTTMPVKPVSGSQFGRSTLVKPSSGMNEGEPLRKSAAREILAWGNAL